MVYRFFYFDIQTVPDQKPLTVPTCRQMFGLTVVILCKTSMLYYPLTCSTIIDLL